MNISDKGQLNYLDISEVGITNGLVGYWKLNGDAKDYSGNGYDGTVVGATVTGGLKDLAYSFSSGSTYIDLPTSVGYTTNFSASVWFKRIGVPGSGFHIIFGGQELEISIPESTGEIRAGLYTTSRFISNHGSGLTDNNWHHLGVTFDGTTKLSYIDGQNVGTQSVTGILTSNVPSRRIGVYGSNTTYYCNGQISDARIYNRALSPEEINIQYKFGLPNTGMQLSSNGILYLNGEINEGL